MFKFIHAADVHLDSPLRGLARIESAPVEAIRGACRRAFENLVECAIEEKVAFVLLAGDLYDGDWKDYSTGIYLSHQIGRLGQHGIPVYAVAGNHDAANKMTKALDSPSNLKILSSSRVETVTIDHLAVAIHGQSFGTQHVDKNLAAGFGAAEKECFNIGLLHTSLDGREGHAVYAPCALDDLRSKGYQYWALGHVHKQEIVSEDPWVVFSGCIQGRHIRETGPKGCVLVRADGNSVIGVEQVVLDVLRWVHCRVDLTDVTDLQELLERTREAVVEARAAADGRPVAMRIRFEGATELFRKLAAYPERFEQQVRALVAEIGGDEIWVERIENRAAGKLDLHSVLTSDSALGMLLTEIMSTTEHPGEEAKIKALTDVVRQKIPPEVFDTDSTLRFDDPETIDRLVDEAKQMLIGRLLAVGGK